MARRRNTINRLNLNSSGPWHLGAGNTGQEHVADDARAAAKMLRHIILLSLGGLPVTCPADLDPAIGPILCEIGIAIVVVVDVLPVDA
jgi:hypothetical protein